MPRVAPIVRSTRYEHAINTLVAKRSEISGAIRFKGADLAHQLQHIDAVLLILGYKGDPSLIVPLRRTPSRFRKGELYRLILRHEADGSASNRETATRIVQAKGWDAALVKPLMNNIKTAKGLATAEGPFAYGWVAPTGGLTVKARASNSMGASMSVTALYVAMVTATRSSSGVWLSLARSA